MFYSGNDNYMQDLYFGNQMYGANTYNPNTMNNMQNPMYMNNNNGMYMNQVPNQPVNINSMYPSVYRILMPVVSRVVSNTNYQFFNEDVLNNMVDTVYNITEGQINYENDSEQVSTQERNTNSQTNSTSVSQNNQNTTTTSRMSNTDTNQTTRNTNSTNNSNNDLLRDLIKILIIREIISRRQFPNNQNNMNMCMNPYYQ